MTALPCGIRIRNRDKASGSSGCLVSLPATPERIYLLTAGHVVVPADVAQNDPIYAVGGPAAPIGILRAWTLLRTGTTVDAALIWIDPAMVSPTIAGLAKAPAGINPNVTVGQSLFLFTSGAARRTTVAELDFAVDLKVREWGGYGHYFGQIRTSTMISQPGDSGAMVFDEQNNVVGMLVGGDEQIGDIITPIGAILDQPEWKGVLSLVTVPLAGAKPPPVQAAAAPAASAAPVAAPATTGSHDAAHVPALIVQGSTAQGMAAARQTASAALAGYPTNGCAAHLSALLQQAGIDVSMTLGAGMLAHRIEQRGWTRIAVHSQRAGDIGVCFDNTNPPGADHIYLVVARIDDDLMDIADNQNPADAPHRRYATGKGKTPTQYFLRAT